MTAVTTVVTFREAVRVGWVAGRGRDGVWVWVVESRLVMGGGGAVLSELCGFRVR